MADTIPALRNHGILPPRRSKDVYRSRGSWLHLYSSPAATKVKRDGAKGRESYSGDPFLCPAFAHRAWAAFRAISFRCSEGILSFRTFAEAIPPFRPKATACGFFLITYKIYAEAVVHVKHFFLDNAQAL